MDDFRFEELKISIKRFIAFMAERLLAWANSSKDSSAYRLHSLAPEYSDNDHSRYVRRLQKAIFEDRCCNVALSGSYGSGKSSILSRFEEKAYRTGHKLAKVSLATISLDNEKDNQTENGPSAANESDARSSRIVEKLEREILGQLLYQGDNAKAKESAFNRIHRQSLCQLISKAI